jgi:hypothetical protein
MYISVGLEYELTDLYGLMCKEQPVLVDCSKSAYRTRVGELIDIGFIDEKIHTFVDIYCYIC